MSPTTFSFLCVPGSQRQRLLRELHSARRHLRGTVRYGYNMADYPQFDLVVSATLDGSAMRPQALTQRGHSVIEMYVGIICACLPFLKAFAKHHFPAIFDIKSVRSTHERTHFDIRSATSVRMPTMTTSTMTTRKTESVDENVLPLQSERSSNLLSGTIAGHQDRILEEGPPGNSGWFKSKASVGRIPTSWFKCI